MDRENVHSRTIIDCKDSKFDKHREAFKDISPMVISNVIIELELHISKVANAFMNMRKDIYIPRIGNVTIKKNKKDYLRYRQDLIEAAGYESYDDLPINIKEEIDNQMKIVGREIKIGNSKKSKREFRENLSLDLKKIT
jgi:hypothetical protein